MTPFIVVESIYVTTLQLKFKLYIKFHFLLLLTLKTKDFGITNKTHLNL